MLGSETHQERADDGGCVLHIQIGTRHSTCTRKAIKNVGNLRELEINTREEYYYPGLQIMIGRKDA